MTRKKTRKKTILTAITAIDIEKVANFLYCHMNNQFTPQAWQQGISKSWLAEAPNHGFMLISDDQVVGVLCAIYSEQYVSGHLERFCNPHSWCVLPGYRSQSIELVLAVIRQKGYSFTMFSPNKEGIKIFSFLKFKPLDNRISILLNVPSLSFPERVKIVTDKSKAKSLLSKHTAKSFVDHTEFPWLNFLIFSVDDQYEFMIFKRIKYKRLACASIMYVSDMLLFQQCWPALRTHLLFRYGIFSSKIESRLLGQIIKPLFLYKQEVGSQKFFLSEGLSADCIQNIYSELVALDL